jgi:hypothetical protein
MKVLINKLFIIFICSFFLFCLFPPFSVQALTPGALVYRTSGEGKMYGYNSNQLLEVENGVLKHIYPGHVGIYIGKENGEDYIVEALADGIVKTPAKNFVNESLGEEFLGAKMPIEAGFTERLKAVKIAKNLAEKNLGYDFNFKKQKGARDGDWTCVGLVEKIYESAGITNPNNLAALEYDPDYYAVNITPDNFDNKSEINKDGDCFSREMEFSKISRRSNLLLPLPEIIGFNAGREYKGERYFFLPYTQFLQSSLRNEPVDIVLSSFFNDKEIRGKFSALGLILRWSLVNNPLSSLRNVADKVSSGLKKIVSSLFGSSSGQEIILADQQISNNNFLDEDSASKVTINKADGDYHKENDNFLFQDKEETDENIDKDLEDIVTINYQDQEKSLEVEKVISEKDEEISINEVKIAMEEESKIKTGTTPVINKLIASDSDNNEQKNNYQVENSDLPEILPISKIISGIKPTDIPEPDLSPQATNSPPSPTALINKIYSTGMNDFIELYNPTDYDFDLAESGFRIEKTKTADNPSIAIRIGDDKDGLYPGGTVIKARGYYLIVRDDASNFFLSKADAISTRSEFGWTGNGYTLYLGKGPISSSSDEDIIDAVGFGNATYFRGLGSALEIPDNYFLKRINDSADNSLDFNLAVSNDPSIVWDDYIDFNESEDNNDNQNNDEQVDDEEEEIDDEEEEIDDEEEKENNDQSGDSNQVPADFSAYSFPEPIQSEGISDLWHFSQCYGEQFFSVGRFDCSIEIGGRYPIFTPELSSDIDLKQFTISFYYRDSKLMSSASPSLILKLRNENGQEVKIMLQPKLLQIDGLPNSDWRYYKAPVFSEENKAWRHFALVVDKENNYWSVYFNGQETYRHDFVQSLPSDFSYLEISGSMGSVSLDELAIWHRSLSAEEIALYWQTSAPFTPIKAREQQQPANLKYFWDFNEGHELINEGGGLEAVDSVSDLVMNLPPNSWIWRGSENTGIVSNWGKDISLDFPVSLASKDMSLAFWWRSQFYPKEGRSLISLLYNEGSKLGFAPCQYRRSFYFNDMYGIFSEGKDVDLPYDDNWHHFVLTYDSYRYQLKMYVDGQEKRSIPFYWIKDGEEPDSLLIASQLNSVELDDLGVWEGVLTSGQVAKLYQNSLVN